jgi:hypothetical protein
MFENEVRRRMFEPKNERGVCVCVCVCVKGMI